MAGMVGIVFTSLLFTGCSEDEDEGNNALNAFNNVVGTWSFDDADFDVQANGKNVIQFLKDVGYTDEMIAEFEDEMAGGLAEFSPGDEVLFKADSTYQTTEFATEQGEENEVYTGTWAISADGKKLIIDGDEDGAYDLKKLTSNELTVSVSNEFLSDVNNDEVDETISFKLDFTYLKD